MQPRNFILPGNNRYQPKGLKEYFGYDNLYRWLIDVEIAALRVLHEVGIIPDSDMAGLTPEIEDKLRLITTTEVDVIEREFTKHDVRALVQKMQGITGPALGRWIHVPLTSYDPIESARAFQFVRAYSGITRPSLSNLVSCLVSLVKGNAEVLQIGRTHGQHALPITVGFWLATVLERIVRNWEKMDEASLQLVGKISGPVGAHNAQFGMNLDKLCGERTFEQRVLEKLGLKPARISTQILPPESTAYFLFSCTMMSAALAQLGRDCRHLMRSEIGEVREEFQVGQVGSSTMAHKRNPLSFENLEGMYIRTKNEFGKVMDTLISEHLRDLVGSSVARDFPIIMVNLQQQLDTLLKTNDKGMPFISRMTVDREACLRNFKQNANVILAEPIYIALQMAGYQKDAHHLVNHTLVPKAMSEGVQLAQVLIRQAEEDEEVSAAVGNIPADLLELFFQPEKYVGDAREKALEIASLAEKRITA